MRWRREPGGKSPIWYQQLGQANVVVIGVVGGVFKVENLKFVQEQNGASLIWAHRLQDLADYVGRYP